MSSVHTPYDMMRTSLPHYYLRHYQLKMNLLYEEETSIARGGEEQLDVKMDVKVDKELDMKISHGRAREEREECARGEEEVQAGPPVGPATRARGPRPRSAGRQPAANRGSASDNKIVNQENKNSADIITWREYEALRNEMRREFRTKDDELKGIVDEIKQMLDATNVTVTGLADQMTDIQRNIADMRLAIENLTAQQQQQDDDDDHELADDAHNARGAPRGHRPRGWVPLGRNGRGQDEEDGLGKPKFSIPKFEGGADVEEYLTWELKIEKLWSLHPNYSEDKKIKLASSEFDGYALRWWDSLVRNRDEDGAQPIRTWRAMKEVMTSRFVPTNYMRNIFDKLTLLRQGVKTVDEYYMEMEMLMAWSCPVNMEASKRADFVKKIHVKTKELIEKKGKSNAARMKRKEMLFKPGDLVDLGASRSTPFEGGDDEDIPTSLLPPSLPTEDEPVVKLKSNEVGIGPMTRARDKHGGEEQLDAKMDVKADKERT
ncbi:hypothetical protein QYE76_017259 [Lolium multiflorum]|uniref:Retrotransposon gag domain-containing protein n=1 Tax=Lolium multiflorum TaxID=4521 RepID=A0AAD8QGB8_LOLMU|nr:hypothetical protein QYE76_017259 [Lolium multiflorum]